MIRKLAFAAAALVLASSSAYGQPVQDVKCLVLSNAFASSAGNEGTKRVAQSAAFFYLGRVDGRWTDGQLRNAIVKERKTLNPGTAGADMQACAKRMQESVRRLQGTKK